MKRTLIAIGGGELRARETLKIDEYVANIVKSKTEGKRPTALFVGTASHDSMPYYNTFHKVYTGIFGFKTDCALSVFGEMSTEKLTGKFDVADMIYVGGGDTLFMLENWRKSGIADMIRRAYGKGTVLCGLSAGAICWFEDIYTDSAKISGGKYAFEKGLGILRGGACPHFDERKEDFLSEFLNGENIWYGLENNSAAVFIDENYENTVSAGGKVYKIKGNSEITEL